MLSQSRNKKTVLEFETLEDRITPTNQQIVNSLYANLLHRSASANESAGFVAQLNSGVAPSVVASEFLNSIEYQENLIRSSYQIFLSRQPSASDVTYWENTILQGATAQQV